MIVLKGALEHHKAQKRSADFIASLCLEHDAVTIMSEFDTLTKQARKQAKEAGLKQRNSSSAIATARNNN